MDVGIPPPPPHSLYSHASFLSQDQVRGGWGGTKKISLESGGTGGMGGGTQTGLGGGVPVPRPGPRSEALLLRGTCCADRGRIRRGFVI